MNAFKTITSKEFWVDAGVRAVRTFFQAALAYVGVTVAPVMEIDFVGAAAVGAGAAVISIAQSIVRGTGSEEGK